MISYLFACLFAWEVSLDSGYLLDQSFSVDVILHLSDVTSWQWRLQTVALQHEWATPLSISTSTATRMHLSSPPQTSRSPFWRRIQRASLPLFKQGMMTCKWVHQKQTHFLFSRSGLRTTVFRSVSVEASLFHFALSGFRRNIFYRYPSKPTLLFSHWMVWEQIYFIEYPSEPAFSFLR